MSKILLELTERNKNSNIRIFEKNVQKVVLNICLNFFENNVLAGRGGVGSSNKVFWELADSFEPCDS